MELRHTFTVPAPVRKTWDTFMDLDGVAGCFPGATVTSFDGDGFEGTCKVKLGPVALVYAGSGTFVERDDTAYRAVIEAMGKDKRGNGTAGATVTISLAAKGEDRTVVDVATDLAVTGKPAQFGRGVMQDVSDKLLQQFVACLEQRFVEPAEVPATEPAPGPSAPEPDASEPSVAGTADGAATPAGSDAPAAGPAAATSGPAVGAPRAAPRAPAAEGDSLDLGGTLVRVFLTHYAARALGTVVGLAIGIWIGRRSVRR